MKRMRSLLAISAALLVTQSINAYDVVSRYKLIDDKLKTEQMLRPFGHDFIIDIGLAANKDLTDVIKDFSDAAKFTGTDQQKLDNASAILTKYDKTEQTVKVNVALGIPIFSFSVWDLKVRPNIRAYVDFGANLGIRTQTLTMQDALDLININIPDDLRAQILATNYSAGNDLLKNSVCDALTEPTKTLCYANQGKYFYPNTSTPDMFMFAKLDGKGGLFNDYTYGEHFFGNFNLYGLTRTDIFQRVNALMIAKGTKIELPKKANNEVTLQADYRLGYQNSNYTTFLSIEEMKLSKMKDRDVESKAQVYGYDPLIRLHADATYKYSAFSLQPFAGVHKRSGYSFSDGVYAGAAAGAHVWGQRLGLQLRGMLDKQYFTITPRLKLWLMQLEYSMKAPVKSTDGDVKLSALHSIDFRLFF